MKEYLFKYNDRYTLVELSKEDAESNPEQYIEIPEDADCARSTCSGLEFYKDNLNLFFSISGDCWKNTISSRGVLSRNIVWQRHTQPEELPFFDDEPKEYLREDGNGSYILELTCKQEATEPHAKHWIEVPVGVNFYYSFASGDKVFTKEHSSLGRLLWQRKPPFSINDQYAEIEKVRQSAWQKQEGGDHYKKLAIQPMEYALQNKLDYAQANVVKYVTRHADKNGKADLLKAKHCIDLMIAHYYSDQE